MTLISQSNLLAYELFKIYHSKPGTIIIRL